VFGREIELIALLGQCGQLLVCTKIVGRDFERFEPAGDTDGERPIYILKRLFGRLVVGRLTGIADAIEDAAGLGLLLGLKAQERVFERHMLIGRIQPHGFAELIPGSFVFSDFQKRVGEVFTNTGAVWRKSDGLLEVGDGLIVGSITDSLIGAFERLVGRIGGLGRDRADRQRK
jgi:hypothetical protein